MNVCVYWDRYTPTSLYVTVQVYASVEDRIHLVMWESICGESVYFIWNVLWRFIYINWQWNREQEITAARRKMSNQTPTHTLTHRRWNANMLLSMCFLNAHTHTYIRRRTITCVKLTVQQLSNNNLNTNPNKNIRLVGNSSVKVGAFMCAKLDPHTLCLLWKYIYIYVCTYASVKQACLLQFYIYD